jgi:tetratricopeptide (TPR) repeat protein
LRAGYEGLEQMGDKAYLSTVAGHLAQALYVQGRHDEADHFAAICRETAQPDDLASQIIWRGVCAKIAAQRGEHEEAEKLAREAVLLATPSEGVETRAETLFDLAEVLELSGRLEEAVASAQEALRLYEQKGIVPSIRRVRSFLAAKTPARS